MPLSKSELLKSRYIVEAHMPGIQFSHFLPGDILEEKDHPLYQSGTVWGHADETDVCKWTTICPNYPHLFRPLRWYEKRELEDMPEYVSTNYVNCFNNDFTGVYKSDWLVTEKRTLCVVQKGDLGTALTLPLITPATREEYEQYINGKTETK